MENLLSPESKDTFSIQCPPLALWTSKRSLTISLIDKEQMTRRSQVFICMLINTILYHNCHEQENLTYTVQHPMNEMALRLMGKIIQKAMSLQMSYKMI